MLSSNVNECEPLRGGATPSGSASDLLAPVLPGGIPGGPVLPGGAGIGLMFPPSGTHSRSGSASSFPASKFFMPSVPSTASMGGESDGDVADADHAAAGGGGGGEGGGDGPASRAWQTLFAKPPNACESSLAIVS